METFSHHPHTISQEGRPVPGGHTPQVPATPGSPWRLFLSTANPLPLHPGPSAVLWGGAAMPPTSYNHPLPSPPSIMRAALMWFERWIVVVQLPSLVRLFATPRTEARQTSQSLAIS